MNDNQADSKIAGMTGYVPRASGLPKISLVSQKKMRVAPDDIPKSMTTESLKLSSL